MNQAKDTPYLSAILKVNTYLMKWDAKLSDTALAKLQSNIADNVAGKKAFEACCREESKLFFNEGMKYFQKGDYKNACLSFSGTGVNSIGTLNMRSFEQQRIEEGIDPYPAFDEFDFRLTE